MSGSGTIERGCSPRSLIAVVAAAATLALSGCHKKSEAPVDAGTATMLRDLSIFALGHPPAPADLAASARDVTGGKLTVAEYVDHLLAKPMGGRLARDIVLGPASPEKNRHPVPVQAVLRSFKDDGGKVYYLRHKCAAKDAVEVQPWWGSEKVRVCPSAYRPDVRGDKDGHTCGAEMLAPRENDTCGCGPYLVFCTENQKQWKKTVDRVQNEVLATTGYVVDENLPIEKLFTMNETVRNNDAELLYRRARLIAGEDPDKLFPVQGYGDYRGKLKPRVEQVPGQQAGVLTTPALTYSSDALRGVLRNFYDYMWCAGVQSSQVTTAAVLGLDVVDLRVGDGWKKLAAMNICTECHARLDYGMQFFWGYPSSTAGVDFRPSMVKKGQGILYGRSIKDVRGTADLTPAGFAKLAVAQPEFGDCMTRRVVDHVFSGTASSRDFEAVHDTFDKTHKIKEMMRTAMLRFASRKDAPARPPEEAPPPPTAPDGKVALSPALRKMIKKDCKECHDEDEKLNLMVPALDRKTLALMLDRVGFGAMPKDTQGIDDAERRAFVTELSRHLFTSPQERDDGHVLLRRRPEGAAGAPLLLRHQQHHRQRSSHRQEGERAGRR